MRSLPDRALFSVLMILAVTGSGIACLHQKYTQQEKRVEGVQPEPAASREIVLQPGLGDDREDFYTGSGCCRECHRVIFNRWRLSVHANRFSRDSGKAPHGGDCGRCHMTGGIEAAVGCEACHGPAGTHAVEPGSAIRPECMVCEVRKRCILCHTRSTTPEFDFTRYLNKVDHGRNR